MAIRFPSDEAGVQAILSACNLIVRMLPQTGKSGM